MLQAEGPHTSVNHIASKSRNAGIFPGLAPFFPFYLLVLVLLPLLMVLTPCLPSGSLSLSRCPNLLDPLRSSSPVDSEGGASTPSQVRRFDVKTFAFLDPQTGKPSEEEVRKNKDPTLAPPAYCKDFPQGQLWC